MNRQLSGSDVARELGITRQTVSATTKRALGKMYKSVMQKKIADSPFEAMLVLMDLCNISNGSMEDVNAFVSLFPKDIRNKVLLDGVRLKR